MMLCPFYSLRRSPTLTAFVALSGSCAYFTMTATLACLPHRLPVCTKLSWQPPLIAEGNSKSCVEIRCTLVTFGLYGQLLLCQLVQPPFLSSGMPDKPQMLI